MNRLRPLCMTPLRCITTTGPSQKIKKFYKNVSWDSSLLRLTCDLGGGISLGLLWDFGSVVGGNLSFLFFWESFGTLRIFEILWKHFGKSLETLGKFWDLFSFSSPTSKFSYVNPCLNPLSYTPHRSQSIMIKITITTLLC